MAKNLWLLCLVVLGACTYLPETTAATPMPCPTAAPCPAFSPAPTQLPFPTATQIPPILVPTSTTQPEPALIEVHPSEVAPTQAVPTQAVPAQYGVEMEMPRLEVNFAYPELGCDWLWIGGQVLDAAGEAEQKRVVLVSGAHNGIPLDLVGLSGSAPIFGPAGFEIRLPTELALASRLFIQIYDLDGAPLSNTVEIIPPANCEKTLVMVNFRKHK